MKYTEIDPNFKKEFTQLADQAKTIIITAHKSADDDSIASVLSTYDYITNFYPNKSTRIIYSGNPEDKFSIFRNYDKIQFVPDLADAFESVDLLIMLDGSQFSRFSEKPEDLRTKAKTTACIDHHSSPTDDFTTALVAPTTSSNAELIYLSLFEGKVIDPALAEVFLLGILGDTGNFLYLKPHQTQTLESAKKLIDLGKIEIQEFQARYRSISKRVFELIQELIKNTEYHDQANWPSFQTSYLSNETKERGDFTDNEVSEASHIYMSHYLRLIDGYPWGFVVTPKSTGDCSISLRSLPKNVSVRTMMEQMGIGGGHDRAAGGSFKKEEEVRNSQACLQEVVDWIKGNSPKLI